MSSQDLKESQDMEQTSSEQLDGTVNTSKDDLDGGLDNVSDSNNTSTHGDELGSYHLDKNVKAIHAPTSSLEASPNDTISVNSEYMMNSSIFSDDVEAAGSVRSLQARMWPDEDLFGYRTTTPPKECSSEMLHDASDYGLTDDESPSPSAPAAFYAKYRKCSADLMTTHMFTGKMKGNRPAYIPVYKRDDSGKLLKLLKDWSGHWRYLEPKEWTDEETEGLKIFEKPKPEGMLQNSGPKKAVGRRHRTLADFGLPETSEKGGWGWL